jgi:hypothetical protein
MDFSVTLAAFLEWSGLPHWASLESSTPYGLLVAQNTYCAYTGPSAEQSALPNRAEREVLNMVRLENILNVARKVVTEAKPAAGFLGRSHRFTP